MRKHSVGVSRILFEERDDAEAHGCVHVLCHRLQRQATLDSGAFEQAYGVLCDLRCGGVSGKKSIADAHGGEGEAGVSRLCNSSVNELAA